MKKKTKSKKKEEKRKIITRSNYNYNYLIYSEVPLHFSNTNETFPSQSPTPSDYNLDRVMTSEQFRTMPSLPSPTIRFQVLEKQTRKRRAAIATKRKNE